MYTAKQFFIRRLSNHFNLARPRRRSGLLIDDNSGRRNEDKLASPRHSISTSVQDFLPSTHYHHRQSSSLSDKYVDFADLCSKVAPPALQILSVHGDIAKNRRARRYATTHCKALVPIREVTRELRRDQNKARRRNSVSGSDASLPNRGARKRHHSISSQGLFSTPPFIVGVSSISMLDHARPAPTTKPANVAKPKPKRPARPPPTAWPGIPATASEVVIKTGLQPVSRRPGTPAPAAQVQTMEWENVASAMEKFQKEQDEKRVRIISWIRKVPYGAKP